jgi:PrcB C-terminal
VLLLSLGGAIAGYLAASDGGPRRPVAWRDLTDRVGAARWARPTISVIRDRQKLHNLFIVATLPPHPRPPRIDFSRREAILVTSGPRSSTGYRLGVESVTEKDGSVDIVVRERTPTLADRVTPRLTYPFLLITIPASGKHVHVRYGGRS